MAPSRGERHRRLRAAARDQQPKTIAHILTRLVEMLTLPFDRIGILVRLPAPIRFAGDRVSQ
jgi:hypothetical protein